MCGRFFIDEHAIEQTERIAPVPKWVQEQLRLGTIYPSNDSLIICEKNHQLQADLMPFGFFSSSMNRRIINARAETVREKRMFARAFEKSRCAAPCSLFYEWTPEKEKVGFYLPDQTLYLACISLDHQFVILTRPANASVQDVHHRMPLILSPGQVGEWIENEDRAEQILSQAGPMLESDAPKPLSLF